MTIEEKLLKDHGTTLNPFLAVWLLKDGTLVNGSIEGYQRDVDHHEIGQYFTISKNHVPGEATLYIQKFMRRGNIRWGMSDCGLTMEYAVTPTDAQLQVIIRIGKYCQDKRLQVAIGQYRKHRNPKYRTLLEFLTHLQRYTNTKTPDIPNLLDI